MPFLTQRTYVNANRSNAVAEGSTEAAFLLGGEGDEVSAEDAKRLKLDTADEWPPKTKAPTKPAERAGTKEA